MANTYQWHISALDIALFENDLEKVVKAIHWRRSIVNDNGNSADIFDVLPLSDPELSNFIVYEDLTISNVESWLENILDVEQLNAQLDHKLNSQLNPSFKYNSLPW